MAQTRQAIIHHQASVVRTRPAAVIEQTTARPNESGISVSPHLSIIHLLSGVYRSKLKGNLRPLTKLLSES